MKRWFELSTILICLFAVSGCGQISYLWQAGMGQMALYNRERPIEEVLKDPTTSSKVRERLEWIAEIKNFVEAELGVKATGNYKTYVDLKRPYVVYSIVVADPYELKLKEWKFPFVGSFPYLGFFKEDMAKEWKQEFADKGFDTYIRGVTAYSTLGYFRDPMLSSMLSRDKQDMVNLIFHETTHGVIYVKGQGSFNEQIASYIGEYGEKLWIEKTLGKESALMKSWHSDREDRRRFGAMIKDFSEEIKAFYASTSGLSTEERKAKKESRFKKFSEKLQSEPWKGRGYTRAIKHIKNNAALLAFLTYEDDQDLFDELDKKCGGQLKAALQHLKKFEDWWNQNRSSIEDQKLTPQSALRNWLVGSNTLGAVCLNPDVH